MWNSRAKLCSITPVLLQESKTIAGFHYSSWIACIQCYKFTIRSNYNGVVVNELELQSSDSSSFSRWGEYDLLFNVDIVSLPLKTNGGEAENLML